MNIVVAGTGYVGLSIAILLAQHRHVVAVDVIAERVDEINRQISPIQDEYIEKYLTDYQLDLSATLDGKAAYRNSAVQQGGEDIYGYCVIFRKWIILRQYYKQSLYLG